jgi:hypothetical protein
MRKEKKIVEDFFLDVKKKKKYVRIKEVRMRFLLNELSPNEIMILVHI